LWFGESNTSGEGKRSDPKRYGQEVSFREEEGRMGTTPFSIWKYENGIQELIVLSEKSLNRSRGLRGQTGKTDANTMGDLQNRTEKEVLNV